jgi:LysR family hydrogen peroxide-inducible transcriptional activator
VKPPIAATDNVVIRRFAPPAPSRTIAMVWRSSSALSGFLRELSECFRELPAGLLKS